MRFVLLTLWYRRPTNQLTYFQEGNRKKIATNVAYKGITDFTEIQIANISDTLDVMDAGTTKGAV